MALHPVGTVMIDCIRRNRLRKIRLDDTHAQFHHGLHPFPVPCQKGRVGEIKAAHFGLAHGRCIESHRLSLAVFYQIPLFPGHLKKCRMLVNIRIDPETQMNVMLFQITDHARRIGEPLQIPLPGAGVRLSLPAVNMDHVDLDLMLLCLTHHLVDLFLCLIGTLRHPKPERPLGDHRHRSRHGGIILQQCFGIFAKQDRIVQILIFHFHVIGHAGDRPHVKTGPGEAVQQHGIAPAAQKERMVLVRLLRVGTERIGLPAVDRLPSLIEIRELLPETVETLVGIQIHRLVYLLHPLILIQRKTDGQVFAHIIHVGIPDLLFGDQPAFIVIADLPGVFSHPHLQLLTANADKRLRLRDLHRLLPCKRKHLIAEAVRIPVGKHLESDRTCPHKIDRHHRPVFVVGLHLEIHAAAPHLITPDSRQKIKIMSENRLQIPQLRVVAYFYLFCHRFLLHSMVGFGLSENFRLSVLLRL